MTNLALAIANPKTAADVSWNGEASQPRCAGAFDTVIGHRHDTDTICGRREASEKIPRLRRWEPGPHGTMVGDVYDHPKFADGKRVRTSLVLDGDNTRLRTLNRTYLLGEPKS